MKEGLLERIEGYGFWRVNITPVSAPPDQLLLSECREIVRRSAVSIRGWDYPHINVRNDAESGFGNFGTYTEDWIDWHGFLEFWRMYRSSQFLSYNALREDTKPGDFGNPQVRVLDAVGAIFQITEITDFCQRLVAAGLYASGIRLRISLRNTQGRLLRAGINRMPFHDRKENGAKEINLDRDLDASQFRDSYRSVAVGLCIELFDQFGWSPVKGQIEAEQEKFYRQDWR